MDKRLAKRHKRQVARAKEHVKTSEPDVRTPEEIKAAREASRAAIGNRSAGPQFSAPSGPKHTGPVSHAAAKTDA
jgi:hypothetical protein